MIKLVQRELLSCEAIVRRTPNGELLLVCQCGDVTEPAPLNRVYVWHSRDDGENWSGRKLLVPEDGRAVYQTEVSVIGEEIRVYVTFHDGRFCINEHAVYISRDSGYTWEKGSSLPFLQGFYFVRGLLQEENKHFLPYQLYDISEEQSEKLSKEKKFLWNAGLDVVRNGVLISEDGGKTYTRSEGEALLPLKDEEGKLKFVWSEPSVARMPDKTLAMLLRFDYTGRLYLSRSADEGKTWSVPRATDIPNPSNKVKLIPLEKGKIALFHTPNCIHGISNRHPLSVWVSFDGMKTWEIKKNIWDLDGWISYPDGFIENGVAYIAVELNRHDVYFIKERIF